MNTQVANQEDVKRVESGELVMSEDKPIATREGSTVNSASPLMQIIERISQMPELDLDRVDRLFEIHEQMLDREAEAVFNESMAAAQGEIQSVVVNKINDHTKKGYADLSAIHEQAKPVWTKHGFSVVSRTKPSSIQSHICIHLEVRHRGGHKEVYEDDWPLDLTGAQGSTNKTAIQAKGSSITYARRYSELAIFDVAIKGEDNDGNALKAPELSDSAANWVSKLEEAVDMETLQSNFRDGYKELGGDGYGRNQLIKAKDSAKKRIQKQGK